MAIDQKKKAAHEVGVAKIDIAWKTSVGQSKRDKKKIDACCAWRAWAEEVAVLEYDTARMDVLAGMCGTSEPEKKKAAYYTSTVAKQKARLKELRAAPKTLPDPKVLEAIGLKI